MNSGFADALKDLRLRAGLSLSEVARRANCSKSEVGHAETGHRLPTDPVVAALDRALDSEGMLVVLASAARANQRRFRAAKRAQSEVVVRLRVEGQGVIMALDRRSLLQGGAAFMVTAFGLASSPDKLVGCSATRMLNSPLSINEVLIHVRDQWHELVKADNMLGPQAAISHVRNQLTILGSLLTSARGSTRCEIVQLGAQYAESIAWLHEDLGNMVQARHWVDRAAGWAFEAGDDKMLAWTMFRRSQQAGVDRDGGQVIGLTRAIRRNEGRLPKPMQAVLRVQEAFGHALDGDMVTANRLLDQAHELAMPDSAADARGGHGSFCTPEYVEVNRANCLLTAGRPASAVQLYEQVIPQLPDTYLRDRTAAASRMAAAYAANCDVELAARTVSAVMPTARSTGSVRIIREIERVAASLAPHRKNPVVAAMLEAM